MECAAIFSGGDLRIGSLCAGQRVFSIAINGQTVGEDVFNPGWTDYSKRVQYSVYDVTALLRPGENALGALLGDASELRLIHGRGGGRIRVALHQWLRHVSSVRDFRLDPRNDGVTIVRS